MLQKFMSYFSAYAFRQIEGENSIIIGKISSRPKSMSKLSTIFEKSENKEKFSTGPTKDKPGPTFPKVVMTAVMDVVKS